MAVVPYDATLCYGVPYHDVSCLIVSLSRGSLCFIMPVSVKNTPPDGESAFESTESGAGLQFLLLGRMAKAHVKGVLFHRHR